MTPDQKKNIEEIVTELVAKVEDLENERDAIKELPGAVGTLAVQVQVLHDIVVQGFDGRTKVIMAQDGQTIQKANSWDTAIKVATGVIVPIVLALIGGYFALKAALPASPK